MFFWVAACRRREHRKPDHGKLWLRQRNRPASSANRRARQHDTAESQIRIHRLKQASWGRLSTTWIVIKIAAIRMMLSVVWFRLRADNRERSGP